MPGPRSSSGAKLNPNPRWPMWVKPIEVTPSTIVQIALGDALGTDTLVYAGTLGAEANGSTYGATTLGAALNTDLYPPS